MTTKPGDVVRVFERTRPSPPVPEPMFGWAICKKVPVEKEGSLYLPTPGATGMEVTPEEHRGVFRLQVVKTSAEYLPPRSMNNQKTPFEPGAFVQLKPDFEMSAETYPLMLPADYVAVGIHSIATWRPGKLDERQLDS